MSHAARHSSGRRRGDHGNGPRGRDPGRDRSDRSRRSFGRDRRRPRGAARRSRWWIRLLVHAGARSSLAGRDARVRDDLRRCRARGGSCRSRGQVGRRPARRARRRRSGLHPVDRWDRLGARPSRARGQRRARRSQPRDDRTPAGSRGDARRAAGGGTSACRGDARGRAHPRPLRPRASLRLHGLAARPAGDSRRDSPLAPAGHSPGDLSARAVRRGTRPRRPRRLAGVARVAGSPVPRCDHGVARADRRRCRG